MKNIILKYKKNKHWLDLIIVTSIILITFIVWRGILNQSIEGEGFYYFNPLKTNAGLKGFLFGYDNLPWIFTSLMMFIFGGNMEGYVASQLVVMILLVICEYFIIKSITKSRLIALVATLYFATNFSGNYQIYARGHFQWFTQRVFELFPVLFSTFFLSKFYKNEKCRYYLFAFLLFVVALFMSHYTTLLLPIYPSFFLILAVFKKTSVKKRVTYLLLSLPFIILNYFLFKHSTLGEGVVNPAGTYLPIIDQIKEYIFKVSHQLVVVTLPLGSLSLIARTFNAAELKIIITAPFSTIALINATIPIEQLKVLILKLSIPVYLFYGTGLWFLYKKKSPQFYLVLILFLALLGNLFLSAYTNRFDVYNAIFEGRYFFIPGLYVGIIFSCFLFNLIPDKSKKGKINIYKPVIIMFLVLLWIVVNFKLINIKIKNNQYKYRGQRVMLNYLKEISMKLPENSIVVLPSPLMPEGVHFLEKFYNNSSHTIKYYNLSGEWQKKLPAKFNLSKLYVFTLSDEMKRGGNAQLNKINVVDSSESYRKQIVK